MKAMNCLFERVSNFSVGMVLLLMGLALIVISATILPVVGLAIALPVLAGSVAFFAAHRSKECSWVSIRD
ncbi:MAG: hypothetical protein ACOWWM_08195 [Desulfobacterales bacterium]